MHGIDLIDSGNTTLSRQKDGDISYAFKIRKKDCRLNWSDSAEIINNKIRAFTYTPGAFTFFNGKKLKVFKSDIIMDSQEKLNFDLKYIQSISFITDMAIIIKSIINTLTAKWDKPTKQNTK